MTDKNAEKIRVAAYYIWEKAGRPEGKDEEIWFQACAQMAKGASKTVAKKAVAQKAKTAVVVKPVNKPVAKVAAKPVVKKETKPVVAAKPAAKKETKPVAAAKPAPKAKPAKKAKVVVAKVKYNPIPVKSSTTRIITPLYGAAKK